MKSMLNYFFIFLGLLYLSTLLYSNIEGMTTTKKEDSGHQWLKYSGWDTKKDGITIGGDGHSQTINENTQGIPKSKIPKGQEDLYILKSQIVPPVCPKCPEPIIYEKECPPCPRCERCPEPSFECKKVPTYDKNDTLTIPRPILNDFSQFGL